MSVSVGSSTSSVATDYNTKATGKKKQTQAEQSVAAESSAKKTSESGVVYEKAEETNKATYSINKMSAEDRAALVEKLKQDQEDRKSQLSSLVQQMLSKQAGASDLASIFSEENLKKVSAEDIEQAKKDVAEDGYWGVKQTSQRLFDFASALAGDDVDKMKEMQEAMEKGFKMAREAWGKDLPQISQDTLDAANKLFDDYYKSKEVTE